MPITSTEIATRAALLARMQAVTPSLGRMYDEEQYTVTKFGYPTDADKDVLGAEILFGNREGKNVERIVKVDTGTTLVYRMYTIRLWRSIKPEDGSNETFRGQVTALCNRLTENLDLATGIILVLTALPEVVTYATAIYGTKSCHMAEVEVMTQAEEHVPEWT